MNDLGSRGSSPPPIWTLLDAQPWADLDDHMGASRSLRQVESWLSSCEVGHEYCLSHGSGPGKYFPTRVIDVDRVEDGTVYLRERSEVETGFPSEGHKAEDLWRGYPTYWTLSHRWGDPELIQQLSQSTENRLRSGMGVSDLSPTFRDACLIVRRMGYRYIWIDSLCIFQDSLSEWQQEAKAMVDVYRHSFCNISAIGASSNPSSIGLFSRRRLPLRLLFPFKVHGQHLDDERGFRVGPWVFLNDSIWTDGVASTPLSTRGWVVQERFLAPRVLHFTENQIYWECLETTVCEADPSGELQVLAKDWHLRPPIQTVYKAAGREIARSLSKVLSGQQYITREEETAYLTLWGDLVSTYANCALTNESDRLIAMSGIAKSFQEANKDTYLAGLWKKVIHSDLTWKTDASDGAKVFRSDSSYAPTWSWASVVGGRTTLNAVHQKYRGIPVSLINLVAERIVSEPPGGDPTGLLRSAELDIECMLYYYRWTPQSTTLAVFKDEARHNSYFRKEFGSQHLHLDTADMVRKFKEMAEVEGAINRPLQENTTSSTPRQPSQKHTELSKTLQRNFNSTAIMKTTTMLMIAAFASSALSLEVKDASTAGGGTPGSPACNRQCLITISPVDGASTQRSDGFPGSCKEYATGQLKGINRSVDGGRLNINGVGGNLVIDFVKNGRDRRASFTNCKEAVFTGAQCSLKQGGCDKQAESG
ncbi:hypothetical protein FOPG_14170 [Fusarium oxysporum f. sp. conglutinans race 2 54008]|uniref:Heterokaryon incompatibility domain-containing protein n=1 Tax=Fusarium oxysporum f. sp. conglutinans race 2 54008 TaxID=1089457 RepID=X0HDF7_FUSOX|nr:hypothetical protein FOPG_14170 [Fusarium oxysporum f. sp. conglutinans race 2 54008]